MIRDRIVDLRRVPASELIPNPANWRTHPEAQAAALRGVLAEIGYADALIARETPAGLMLLDGHLRAETTPDQVVPVLVVDLNDDEAALLLATLDPLGAMANANTAALETLLAGIATDQEAITAMLGKLAADSGVTSFDPLKEWQGMPAFNQPDAQGVHRLTVHFGSKEAIAAFALAVGQRVTDSTHFIWYPAVDPLPMNKYIAHES